MIRRTIRHIMTTARDGNVYVQVEERLPWNNTKLQQLRSLNNTTRKKAPHRKPPRQNVEETSPIGVLQSFEIPKLLETHADDIARITGGDGEGLKLDDVENPVRDIINDAGVLDAFNSRVVKNVEVLSMSAKGDGLALIRAPKYEDVLECQEKANEREMAAMTGAEAEGKKRKRPYRRSVDKEKMPKVQVAAVPYAFPGDVVDIRVYHTNTYYVDSEIVSFVKYSELRGGEKESACAYFGICSGCQYQPVVYENQLKIKKEVVVNAFEHFCQDAVDWKGKVLDTVGSPLQYGYRTKLTPHYDVPRSGNNGLGLPRLGFGWRGKGAWMKIEEGADGEEGESYDNSELKHVHEGKEVREGMRKRAIRPYFGDVLDIEDCIIGTDVVRLGMVSEREKLKKEWESGVRSKKGVTVLLREHSEVKEDGEVVKTCVTDNQSIVSELVDTGLGRVVRFDFIANEFFQNNNSILPKVIKYVYDKLGEDMEYLVDAYCGSGLFSVSIASHEDNSHVKKVLGVEISERAVEYARRNAKLNNISEERCAFVWGKAEKLFEHIEFGGEKTGVILDPPRKGCDELFLDQLSAFRPLRVVYISCNVHSQARDLRYFLEKSSNGQEYEIESICGFDFFPQTHHVESVAVLVRKS